MNVGNEQELLEYDLKVAFILNIDMHKCDICGKEFDRIMALCGHKAWHVKRSGLDTLAAIERHIVKKEKNVQAYYETPLKCKFCSSVIPYRKASIRRSDLKRGKKNTFCGSSCAASYNNTHKTYGIRVSKLEKWIAGKLSNLLPSLEVHYNRKDAINSELDIYIPSLKLAFELNGVFHYRPIFSEKQFKEIQRNDQRKLIACGKRGIELVVIDTSAQAYVKESTCMPFLEQILSIIDAKKLSREELNLDSSR